LVNHISDIRREYKRLQKEGADTEIDFGAAFGGMPGDPNAIVGSYGEAKSDIAAKPIAKDAKEGDYKVQTDKQKAELKRAAEEKKRQDELRKQMELDIDLIRTKAKIANDMFAVDSKEIVLGQEAISQEKMLLDLASSIAEIRINATKERAKDKAQVDLINQKEQEQITARVAQFGYENGLRMQQRERNHKLAMQAISDESDAIHHAQTTETWNLLNLLDIEKNKFKLGSDAYELTKLQVEENNTLRNIHVEAAAALKQVTREYELSAQSAQDLELYEANIAKIRGETVRQLNYTVLLEGKKRDNLKEQQELQKQMFALDLAQQKGRDIANIQSTLNVEKQMLQLQGNRYLMSTNQYNLSNLALENIHRLIEAENKYNDQMKEAEYEMKRQGGGQRAREEYEQRIKSIEEIRNIELDAINQINDARQRNLENEIYRQKSFTEGWSYAARQFRENSENAFKRGEAAFSSVMSNMETAIGKFADTGKFKFEEFALSVIKDLIRMEMQAQATMLFRSIVGFFSPAPITTMNYDAGVGTSVGFAAAGGAINAPTIVGENGAELFVPNTPGTIIPNGSWQQAAASMGNSGFTNNGTYIANMSAIDTQSATQFLASNKNTIWAAYQSANRSVPISR
jgi:lambda family phage tail tape measure protein